MERKIDIERVYEDPAGKDGYRVFVDRLWPRGESKEKFHYDLWAKEISPSTELREWFHEDPENRWDEFRKRYLAELDSSQDATELVEKLKAYPRITLLYSSKDHEHNNAVVLKEFLMNKLGI